MQAIRVLTPILLPGCFCLITAACSNGAQPGGAATTSGGAPPATGGASTSTGGVATSTGGAPAATGGASPSSGGAASGGTATGPTGGSVGSGGATAGSTSVSSGGGGAAGSGMGGLGASGGGTTATGGGTGGTTVMGTCTFTPTATTSGKIGSVGIVEWSVTGIATVQQAQIDFGLDTKYGMTAPVDPAAAKLRTLLLGMKYGKTYHYKITATGGGTTCTSPDYTVMTGAAPNGLQKPTITSANAAAVYGGFLITGQYSQNAGGTGSPAYILDADGDVVWNYSIGRDVTGAVMSYDGKYMWINSANVPESQGANVHRVSMDGLTDENLTSQFTGLNHQLTVLPDETVAFYAYSSNGCDDVKLRSPDGQVKTVVNSMTAEGSTNPMCHLNNVQYFKEDDSITFSDLPHNCIVKVKRDGSKVWVIGGSTSTFTGDGSSWTGQHGVHLLGLDRLLFFNNGSGTAGSIAIELKLDLTAKTATKAWSYSASSPIANAVMGDVQRLPNGNTIVAYSTKGVLHEVDAQGKLLQELTWAAGGQFGFIQKRKTLYGPPPR